MRAAATSAETAGTQRLSDRLQDGTIHKLYRKASNEFDNCAKNCTVYFINVIFESICTDMEKTVIFKEYLKEIGLVKLHSSNLPL